MRLVCLSDTHGLHRQVQVPEGDILIHAGDCTTLEDSLDRLADFNAWLGDLPHPHKLVIAGNHDLAFVEQPARASETLSHAVYLENSGVELMGLRFWGSPNTLSPEDMAFGSEAGEAMRRIWRQIPVETDVLVTHGPPFGTGDREEPMGGHLGCLELTECILRLQPKLHVFGHIHGGYGQETNRQGTRFVNCALLGRYRLQNSPIVIDLS